MNLFIYSIQGIFQIVNTFTIRCGDFFALGSSSFGGAVILHEALIEQHAFPDIRQGDIFVRVVDRSELCP